jgi:hypothetical protein
MRFGLAAGLAAGYYLGTKAGRERYEELQHLLGKLKRSEAYETATEKAKAAVDLGVERAREVVEDHKPGSGAPTGGGGTSTVTTSGTDPVTGTAMPGGMPIPSSPSGTSTGGAGTSADADAHMPTMGSTPPTEAPAAPDEPGTPLP